MNPIRWFVTYACKLGLEALCKIEKENWDAIPQSGPLIAYANHTGTVEVPLGYTQMQPRKITGLAKIETWDNWFLGWVFNLWEVIPVRRGEVDMEALRKCLDVLEKGYILGISPEGTRSKSGALIRARGGIALLALKSGAPLLPIGQWGGQHFGSNVKKFKRTLVHFKVGRIFCLDARGKKVTKEIRQQMADEMMYQLAKLLPECYRGEYSDVENATEKYIHFIEPSHNSYQ
jgi:1-acyl-sn-glycerol-3-phosphate acyltransferase